MLRRKARVAALQILFQMDMRDKKLEEVLPYFKVPKGVGRRYPFLFFRLVQGVETKKRRLMKYFLRLQKSGLFIGWLT